MSDARHHGDRDALRPQMFELRAAAAAGAALPATGGDIALAAGVGVAGAGLIAMGGALVVRRRRS